MYTNIECILHRDSKQYTLFIRTIRRHSAGSSGCPAVSYRTSHRCPSCRRTPDSSANRPGGLSGDRSCNRDERLQTKNKQLLQAVGLPARQERAADGIVAIPSPGQCLVLVDLAATRFGGVPCARLPRIRRYHIAQLLLALLADHVCAGGGRLQVDFGGSVSVGDPLVRCINKYLARMALLLFGFA